MNLEKLNQSITLLANLGVLAGIIFLAMEIQQNTHMMQAQTRDAITEKQLTFYTSMFGDSETLESLINMTSLALGERPANRLDGERFRYISTATFRMWENEWYQYQSGLFDQAEFEPRLENWKGVMRVPIYRTRWQGISNQFSPEFRQLLNEMIEKLN